MFFIEPNNPKACNNQITKIITTTALRMFLIFLSIGIKEFTNQSNTPATINTITIESKDIKIN